MDIACLSHVLNQLDAYEIVREHQNEDQLRRILLEAALLEDQARRLGNAMILTLRCMLQFGTGLIFPTMLELAGKISAARENLQAFYNSNYKGVQFCLKELRYRHLKLSLQYKRKAFNRTTGSVRKRFKNTKGLRVKFSKLNSTRSCSNYNRY